MMRQGPRAFPKLSTRDSVIPSSCEMKDEPAVNPLQGNTAFFRVRASCCPFHLRQHNQGRSNILIAERILLLMCLLKGGFPLESKPGNQLSSQGDLYLISYILFTSYIKEVKAHLLFDGEHRISLHAMKGNQASSHGDGEVSWFFSTFIINQGYTLT